MCHIKSLIQSVKCLILSFKVVNKTSEIAREYNILLFGFLQEKGSFVI